MSDVMLLGVLRMPIGDERDPLTHTAMHNVKRRLEQ